MNVFRKRLVFGVQPTRTPDLNPSDLYLWEHLHTAVYSAAIESEDFTSVLLMSVKSFAIAPGPLKGCDSP